MTAAQWHVRYFGPHGAECSRFFGAREHDELDKFVRMLRAVGGAVVEVRANPVGTTRWVPANAV